MVTLPFIFLTLREGAKTLCVPEETGRASVCQVEGLVENLAGPTRRVLK